MFYIHGTINKPVSNTKEYIASTKSPYEAVYGINNVSVNNNFSWESNGVFDLVIPGRSGLLNQPDDRAIASKNLTAHIDAYIANGIYKRTIDINRPLKIVLNGFSHGGNVALQAAPDIAHLQNKHGIKRMSIDVNGFNTPQYTNNLGNFITGISNPEDPSVVNSKVIENSNSNVKLNHVSFYTKNDGVGGKGGRILPSASIGGRYPANGITQNHELTAPKTNNLNPIDVHGAAISDPSTRKQAAGIMHVLLINQKRKEDQTQAPKIAPRL